jgi:hypothetical protein
VDWSRLSAGRRAGPAQACIAGHQRPRNAPREPDVDAGCIADVGPWYWPTAPRTVTRAKLAVRPTNGCGRLRVRVPMQGAAASRWPRRRERPGSSPVFQNIGAFQRAQDQYGQCSRRADGTATGSWCCSRASSLRSSRAPPLRCWRWLSATSTSIRRAPRLGARARASRGRGLGAAAPSMAGGSCRWAAATAALRGHVQDGRRDERLRNCCRSCTGGSVRGRALGRVLVGELR